MEKNTIVMKHIEQKRSFVKLYIPAEINIWSGVYQKTQNQKSNKSPKPTNSTKTMNLVPEQKILFHPSSENSVFYFNNNNNNNNNNIYSKWRVSLKTATEHKEENR